MSSQRTLLILSEEPRASQLQNSLQTAGFRAVTQQTAQAGFKFIEKAYPNLVLIGSHLGDETIFDTCRQLRQSQYHVPLMVYAEQADEYDRILTLEIGADDYIPAPITPRELVARIRAQLRRAYQYSRPDTEMLTLGSLTVDCRRGQAFCNQRALDLTPIEFRLLKFLAQNRNQVLSRGQILEQIWGYELQPYGERMVNVHICRLRRKVEADPANPAVIVTVRGLGYCLAPMPTYVA